MFWRHAVIYLTVTVDQLEQSLQLPPEAFERHFKVKAPKKEADNIVFHCQRGRRSLNALDIAWKLGFSRQATKRSYPIWTLLPPRRCSLLNQTFLTCLLGHVTMQGGTANGLRKS